MQKLYKIQCCNRQIFERFILIYEKMFHYASAAYATLEALCFALSVIILRRPNFCQSNAEYIFFCFAIIMHGLWWNSPEVAIIMNIANNYISGEISTGTREQSTRANLNRGQIGANA